MPPVVLVFTKGVGLQLVSRVLTFQLNLFVVRLLSPSVYGLVAFRLPLLNASVLLLSREAFRRGCIRKDTKKEETKEEELWSALPFACVPIPLGLLFTAVFFLYFSYSMENAVSWIVILVAILVELVSEPLYIVASLWLEFKLRARVEGMAVFAKSFSTFLLVKHTARDPVLAFADAQILYALVLLAGYSTLLPRIFKTLKKDTRRFNLDWQKLRISGVFFVQTCEKQVLAEGSKLVLLSFKNLYDEGVYGLVNNLGSLIVRNLFQPFEEAAFTAFSRTTDARDAREMERMTDVLSALIRCVFLIGLLPVVFGPPSSFLFLRILYSHQWSDTDAPLVLAWYCPYITLMSLNGICEAFVHAVLDEKGLGQSNLFMLFSAGLHVSVSIVLVSRYGAVGLVLADSISMIGRIAFSLWCIKRYFKGATSFSIARIFPHKVTLLFGVMVSLGLFVCRWILTMVDTFLTEVLVYAIVGFSSSFLLLWILWRTERNAWNVVLGLKQSQDVTKED